MAGLLPALLVPNAFAQLYGIGANVPLFQFAIFYNVDLDINPDSALTIGGKTFSNGNIWIYPSGQVTFQDTVACAGTYNFHWDTNGCQTVNISTSPKTPICSFTDNGGRPLSHVSPIVLSIGANGITNNYATNIEAILQPPPPAYAPGTSAAYTTNGLIYVFNVADLIISNTASAATNGTNITVVYQNQFNATTFQTVLPDAIGNIFTNIVYSTNAITHKITTNTIWVTNMCYSYATNVTFYDFREGKTNNAIQIDVARLCAWFTNNAALGGNNYNVQNTASKGHNINSIYVYNFVPLTSTRLPSVRAVNGQQLPSAGLTLATPMPLYVEGNYNVQIVGSATNASAATHNTAYTYPAALLADSITVLSSSWQDNIGAYAIGGSYASRPAASYTTINAACLEGIVQSTNFPGAPSGGCYSGGVENFLRLEEDWGSSTLWYNGSIVVLFPSQYATNYWQMPGAYYGVPTRNWAFDTNYLNPTKLPPLTPLFIINTNPPVITTQPQSQTIALSNTATFTIMVSGSRPFAYQWSFNGGDIYWATNASLTLTNVQLNRAGNYSVLVTNLYGSALSSNAILIVVQPPSISAQPTNQTVLVNGTATFNVIATGSSPLNYQWSFNGTNLDGATNALLTLMDVNTNNTGSYFVVVTNLSGSVTSSMATLTLVFPPTITVQPTCQTVLSGSNVTLSITVTGTGPFYYQWYLNGVGCFPYPIVAGTGVQGCSGDNGPATNAMLAQPSGLAVDSAGNLYITDYLNNRIRRVDTNGIITTVAGNGSAGFLGDGYQATNASLWYPNSVKVDSFGNLYIADTWNECIRKVDTNGIITTIAGNGSQGFSGDGGLATNATFLWPTDVAVDSLGNLYIADWYNNRIRKVDTNGIINTVAGNGNVSYSGDGGPGTNASLASPLGVAVDVIGNLYIADRDNNRIRKVDSNGIISTVAGNGVLGLPGIGVAATNTSLACPTSIAVDAIGNLYIAGYTNYCIFRVDTNGIIAAVPAAVHSVCFVAVDAAGNLYYDDTMVNQTRLKTFMGPTLTFTNIDLSDAGGYFVSILTPYGGIISSNAVLSVYATAAATLGGYAYSANNGFQFQIAGVPGFNYAVQESTNLIDWVSLITNTSPFIFTDANATNSPQQFYRAFYAP